jgi:peptide/nickel transport system substrate-binding protein
VQRAWPAGRRAITFGQTAAKSVDEWGAADDKTVKITLKRPFPLLIDAIAVQNSFIMPERLAKTDPFKAAGYHDQKAVIINPTDFATIGPLGEITYDMLKKIGINAELQATDWGSVVQRRANTEPVEKGGWSVFHTWCS